MKAAERENKLHNTGLRLRPAMRAQLERAASKSGHSLTREIETRLEWSFVWEEAVTRKTPEKQSVISGNGISAGLWTGELKDWPGNAKKDPT